MTKTLLFLLSITLLFGCKSETKSNENQTVETEQALPHFHSLKEMLVDASEYYEENGSLKFISDEKSNLHVQISKPILENDGENVKEEIVKRDIVYVAFQTFAQTDINELTITSVQNDMKNREKYYEKYKKTVKVDRAKAKSILKEHLNSNDFSILYKNAGTIWLPNENFDKLKFEKLNSVFNELTE